MRWLLLIMPVSALLCGCARVQVEVRDRSSGVAVVHAQAIAVRTATPEAEPEVLDQADSRGRLSVPLRNEPGLRLGIRAQGYVLWLVPATELAQGPRSRLVELEPAWMGDFLRTGKRPSDLPDATGCNCPGKRSR